MTTEEKVEIIDLIGKSSTDSVLDKTMNNSAQPILLSVYILTLSGCFCRRIFR